MTSDAQLTQGHVVFILSLPRSGSTMLQRIMASHDQIASAPEPYLASLLAGPLCEKARLSNGVADQSLVHLHSTIKEIAHFGGSYEDIASELLCRAYATFMPEGSRYFVDKSPGYCHFATAIHQLMPRAKYVFLFRHPLAIASSYIRSFGNNRWRIGVFEQSLTQGHVELLKLHEKIKDQAYALRYEDLAANPEDESRKLFAWLNLDAIEDFSAAFSATDFSGFDYRKSNVGGNLDTKQIHASSLDKWKKTFSSPVRRQWAIRHLQTLGRDRLQQMGYHFDDMIDQVKSIRGGVGRSGVDLAWAIYDRVFHRQ